MSVLTAEQQTEMSRRFGNSGTNGDEQSLYGATLQVPEGKNPMELDDNGFFEQMKGTPQDVNSDLSRYRLGGGVLDRSATQAMGGSNAQYRGIGRPSEGNVMQNTTGTGFMADIAERESIAKMPLSTSWGYDVKDNIKVIEQIEKQYEDEITVAVEIAKSIVPSVVLEIADKAVVFLPPHLQVGARGILIAIDIGLAVYEVYDQWDTEVRAYEQKYKCSREVAEENVELAKKVHDAFMIFSTHKWLQYVMRSAGHPADLKITVGTEVLKMISEDKLKEWGRMLTK